MQRREPGQLLAGKYRLIRLLGQGGMGSVWHAQHLTLNAPVALKFIESERLDATARQRFLGEARLAAALRSPHVVQILDYGVDEKTPHIAMELLDGETLAARLERLGRLSLSETARVVQHVARAIARAHDAGVIHRDLKPPNVFIVRNDDDEIIKVLDFGIAKASAEALGSSASPATRTGALLGTPHYMSPEQFDSLGSIDFRTDLWSLGVLAYRCLLGELPFSGDNMGSVALAICARPLPVPSERGAAPQGFDAWFASACARDREARFGSAREASSEFMALCERSDTWSSKREPSADPALELPAEEPGQPGASRATLVGTATGQTGGFAGRAQHGRRRWRQALPLLVVLGLGGVALLGDSRLGRKTANPTSETPVVGGARPTSGAEERLAASADPVVSTSRRRSVAVISLRNTLGRSADAWLGAALADVLRTELESGDQLRTVSRERVATMKRDLDLPETDSLERSLLNRIQVMLDVDMTLLGAYWRLPESGELRIDVTLQDARSGETVASVAEHGEASELFAIVSRAGERLRGKLGAEALSAEQRAQVERTLPKDPEARTWYAEGRAKLDRVDYVSAKELFAKVVDREPDFALGHAMLSEAWAGLRYDGNAAQTAERARVLSSELPRQQRLLVEARAYRRNGQLAKASSIFRSLFTVFPDDIDFGVELARAQMRANQTGEAQATIQELRGLVALHDDPRIDFCEAQLAGLMGDPLRQAASAHRAAERAAILGMRTLQIEARCQEADGLFHQGRRAEARDILLDAHRESGGLQDRGAEANAMLMLGQQEAQGTSEDPALARRHLSEALQVFEQIGNRGAVGITHNGLGLAWSRIGRWREAEGDFRVALQIFEETSATKRPVAGARANLADVLAQRGELAMAADLYPGALEAARVVGNSLLEGLVLCHQAEVFLLLGRLAEARAGYSAALPMRQKDPMEVADTRIQMAVAQRISGELSDARAQIDAVLPALRNTDNPGLLESCLLLQMDLDLDEGEPDRVLAGRDEWSKRFGSPYSPGIQAGAHGRFALALLAKGALAEARSEADHALHVLETSDEAGAHADAILTDAKVKAASGDREGALSLLRGSLELARRAGRPSEYETELAIAELEKVQHLSGWKAKLDGIAKRAQQEQFVLYANRATAMLD